MEDKHEFFYATLNSFFILSVIWIVKLVDIVGNFDLNQYGLYPFQMKGLIGIFTMPFLHSDWEHLISNSIPMLLLTFGLFFFYKKLAWKILLVLYIFSGFFTWLMGRGSAVHIGASGVIYALASFHFVSGIIKRIPRQMAFALLVAFLYGGFIWAFFPSLFQTKPISWEGHLSGLLTGIIFAVFFRKRGPKSPIYLYLDKEDDVPDDEDAYWKLPKNSEKEKDMLTGKDV